MSRGDTPTSSRLLVIAVFQVLPLELVACLSVDRQVRAMRTSLYLLTTYCSGYAPVLGTILCFSSNFSVVKVSVGVKKHVQSFLTTQPIVFSIDMVGSSAIPPPPPPLQCLVLTYLPPLQVFGEDIQDASLNQDVLVVSHSRGVYRMYSLPWIMDHHTVVKATVGQHIQLDDMRAGVVGDPGFGVPLTVSITGNYSMCIDPLIWLAVVILKPL